MDGAVFPRPMVAADLKSQRVLATARLVAIRRDGRTCLTDLYQDGAAKIRMPAVEGDWLEAVLINTAGGLTGGDRIGWEVEIGPQASAVVTTQACEKVYRAGQGHAELSAKLAVGDGGHLAWLPQETIVFDRSSFRRRLDLDLGVGASALVAETTLFGRTAMGEQVVSGDFRDRWRIRQAGRLIHAEDFAILGGIAATLRRPAVTAGAIAVATVLLIRSDAEGLVDQLRTLVGDKGGVSAWTVGASGKLLARLYDDDGYRLRKRLVPLLGLLNGQAGLPKTWSL